MINEKQKIDWDGNEMRRKPVNSQSLIFRQLQQDLMKGLEKVSKRSFKLDAPLANILTDLGYTADDFSTYQKEIEGPNGEWLIKTHLAPKAWDEKKMQDLMDKLSALNYSPKQGKMQIGSEIKPAVVLIKPKQPPQNS